jgi:hypothetical protein
MYMKNQFISAFNESLDKESNAGIMHLKDVEAKKAGKTSFKLGDKTFPVKEKGRVLDKEGAGILHFKDQKAKEAGKDTFKLGGKTFPVKENNKKHRSQYVTNFAKNVQEALSENFLEAKPAVKPAASPTPGGEDHASWSKTLDPKTDPKAFDGASNPALRLDTEGVAKAREWVRKLDDMATFINGVDENSLNAQINALEMRNSIPFKGIVRREEKRITKLAENLRGLAELFKTVITSSGKKIHDATSKITTR